jgi:hypothetical protein
MPHPEGDLRWLPSYRHPKSAHSGPALIGRITDVHDAERMISVHQTWIAGDGSGRKAFDHLPREMRPKARLYPFGYPTVGGVIRLSPDCEVTHGLAVGEGVETCLALARCGLPVWSAMDASHLAPFPVLAGIDCLTIAVDHDAAGIKAAEELTARWLAAGREVRRIISAAPGEDAVDIAARVGRAA